MEPVSYFEFIHDNPWVRRLSIPALKREMDKANLRRARAYRILSEDEYCAEVAKMVESSSFGYKLPAKLWERRSK